jgi:hypothetical protein
MFRVTEQMPYRARRERGAAIRYSVVATLVSAGLVVAALPPAAAADADVRVAQAQPAQTPPPPPQYAYPPQAPPQNAWEHPAPGQQAAVGTERSAVADAARDAVTDTNGGLWFVVGCAVGILGVLLGYVMEPSPPPTRLLGRPPEYVAAYTASYRHAGKQEQGKRAMTGCLLGTAITVAVYAAMAASVTTAAQ